MFSDKNNAVILLLTGVLMQNDFYGFYDKHKVATKIMIADVFEIDVQFVGHNDVNIIVFWVLLCGKNLVLVSVFYRGCI